MTPEGQAESLSPLEREEYVEQVYFFSVLGERLKESMPAQDVLAAVREEVLATTKLPLAIDFLLSELKHRGAIADGMKQLAHYFTPFQCYVVSEAENDRRRFDLRIGLEILAQEARYRTEEKVSRQGLFLYQFEALCRNRLGYDEGLEAMARDPSYDNDWRDWILTVRRQIGIVELADLILVRSKYYQERQAALAGGERTAQSQAEGRESSASAGGEASDRSVVLFGGREGRIAWANRQKDPLLLFAAMQRQLGYPQVPRTRQADPEERLLPTLARRVEHLESRLKLVEEEQRGGINLERFYTPDKPESP